MEKSGQDSLKCPRCDSSNTKFCYYNNYSLSQPRHFCKACKRYWTRGGTLRNVPVGGGCRKNKRVKRAAAPCSGGGDGVSSAASNPTIKPASNPNNPSFYSLPANNRVELNFPFSRFSSDRVSSDHNTGLIFDHRQPQNGVGSGFSSELDRSYENGFKQIQDFISTTTSTSPSVNLLSAADNINNININPILFGSSNFAPNSTMATSDNGFSGLMRYEDMQILGPENGTILGKEVKIEGENGPGWSPNYNQIDQQIINSSDSPSLLWNYTTNLGAWFDPNSNVGSSVPSLI